MIWATAAAALVTLVLAGTVALVWAVSRGPAAMPTTSAQQPPTPTPRILSFSETDPDAGPAEPTAGTIQIEPDQGDAAGLIVVSTPELLAMSADGAPASGEGILFEAAGEDAFLDLADGSWDTSADALINAGEHAVAEEWLPLVTAPGPGVAVEAEIRVSGRLEAVCDQSFGIAAGSPTADLVFGGGIIFPCGGDEPIARVTDVSHWQDGYNADEVLANAAFTPSDEWQTYRFEIDDGELTLLVDGDEIVSVAANPAIAPETTEIVTGLWSQGVGLEIRRVTVTALPT